MNHVYGSPGEQHLWPSARRGADVVSVSMTLIPPPMAVQNPYSNAWRASSLAPPVVRSKHWRPRTRMRFLYRFRQGSFKKGERPTNGGHYTILETEFQLDWFEEHSCS